MPFGTHHFVFDIDGVLIASRRLVTYAYQAAGVEMPDAAWGLPWQEWLPDLLGDYDAAGRAHEAKTRVYLEMLEDDLSTFRLPSADIAAGLERSRPSSVSYITGASPKAARAVLGRLGLDSSRLIGSEVPVSARAPYLRIIGERGVYFDDRREGADAAADAGWQFMWVPDLEASWMA